MDALRLIILAALSVSQNDLLSIVLLSPSFFFNDTATTEIYTLSLHDALPILQVREPAQHSAHVALVQRHPLTSIVERGRSEEHTSELQSRPHLVCRLLLEKKKSITSIIHRDICAVMLLDCLGMQLRAIVTQRP